MQHEAMKWQIIEQFTNNITQHYLIEVSFKGG